MKFFILILLGSLQLLALERVTGIVNPIYNAKVSALTDGVVSKIVLKEGDKVRKNQVILKLDDKLQRLETIRRKLVLDDTTQIDSLRESLEIMNGILAKKEKLFKNTKVISLNELNQLRIQCINAKGELDTLISNEKKEKIEYKISREVLNYYTLKSPIEGVITHIKPKLGEWVQVGSEIVSIVNTKTCFVEVDINRILLHKISLNSKITVEIENLNKTIKKEGTVGFISAVVDSSSGLVRVKIYFDNSDNAVRPGVTASIVL